MVTIEKRVETFLAKQGAKQLTAKQIAEQCDVKLGTILSLDCWKEYRKGFDTARKRIAMALQELSKEGVERPTRKQVAERAACTLGSLQQSAAWKNRVLLFPAVALTSDNRIAKAIQALISEGKTEILAKDIAEKAKCSCCNVVASDAWKKFRLPLKKSRIEEGKAD